MRSRAAWWRVLAVTCLVAWTAIAWGVERFPPPDFESGHELPTMPEPGARTATADWVDVILLAVAMGMQAWLVLARRSRNAVAWLTVVWLAYFGFYRGGCVCPVGATQNVALGLADAGYAVPLAVIATFLLPVVFALFVGRVFCGGVCPLGAIQDVVLVRAVRVPRWLGAALGVVPLMYLGLAVLLAATDSVFVICRYDPFVAFFRLSGSGPMLALGGGLLALSTVVARPYCRFVCPYGALLGVCSKVAWKRPSVTPDTCIRCRLCKDACPVDAIRMPDENEEDVR